MKEIKLSDHFTYSKLLFFALPTIGMIMISITYDVVDGYFVSNYIGKTAFSAVNIIYPFQLLLSMVGYMFGSGGSALIAAELGDGNIHNARLYLTAIVKAASVIGIVLANPEKRADFVKALLAEGVTVLTAGKDVIRLLPPLVITKEEMDTAIAAMKKVFC